MKQLGVIVSEIIHIMLPLFYRVVLVSALVITCSLVAWNKGHEMGYFSGVFDSHFKVDFDYWKVIEDYVSKN